MSADTLQKPPPCVEQSSNQQIAAATMHQIATGFWTDYSQSPALGATLTLRKTSANYLLSALTVIVTVASTSAWRLLAFYLHDAWAGRVSPDALDLQHRVMLRNTRSAVSSVISLVRLHFAWAKRPPPQLLRRTLSLLILLFVIFGTFMAASILISRVVSSNGDVARLIPYLCGDASYYSSVQVDHWTTNNARQDRLILSEKYENSSVINNMQPVFIRPTLPYKVSTDAPCPFPNATRCSLGPDGAFAMTSGDRVSFQVNMTCSLLQVEDLSMPCNNTDSTPMAMVNIGTSSTPTAQDGSSILQFSEPPNVGLPYYQLQQIQLYDGRYKYASWIPSLEFDRTHADLYSFILAQGRMLHYAPVQDPWFLATKPHSSFLNVYVANNLFGFIGYAMEWTMCNPVLGLCLNSEQNTTAQRILKYIEHNELSLLIDNLKQEALYINERSLFSLESSSMPDTQWRTEVLGWFQLILAMIQAMAVEYAAKSPNYEKSMHTLITLENVHDGQCRNQLVSVVGEEENFSVLGLAVMLGFCLVIIIASLVVEPLSDRVWGPRNFSSRRLARQADDKLHLLRMALSDPDDERCEWELGRGDIPILAGSYTHGKSEVVNKLVVYTKSSSV
ncbi:hypothetical protein PT974_05105 [Cladobotryum mycophilum]|uniref:Uncharacterized protein n=1 Tax=Cladobotryum mycophilum TaxID=491253 RepID=A0ABR0SRE6_9HYPO